MDLRNLNDEVLHKGNIKQAHIEREELTRMLHRLVETDRRRLYAKFKCESLFRYAVEYLKYSPAQADQRIKAMRAMKANPEIEEKITSGKLNVTNLALAQKLFVWQKKAGKAMNHSERAQVLKKIENQSTRAVEKIVADINPELKRRANALDFNSIEDDVLREKLLRVKGLFAHTDPNMNFNELLHKLADLALEKQTKSVCAPKQNSKAEITRKIWKRDQAKCTNCGSTHAVQVEHKIPKAAGGQDTFENLCLLCRSCNQRSAIEFYGMKKMEPYLERSEEVQFERTAQRRVENFLAEPV